MAKKEEQPQKEPKKDKHIDELEIFIQKKKIQNKALKKIIERINTPPGNKNN